MNRKKLVEVADQVMVDIDIEMDGELRKELELKLCSRLSVVFLNASDHLRYSGDLFFNDASRKEKTKADKIAYDSVKPVLDDCLDKILGEKKK